MGWESFGVVGFDLGPLLQGQKSIVKLKSAYKLIIGPRGFFENFFAVMKSAYISLIIGPRGLGW